MTASFPTNLLSRRPRVELRQCKLGRGVFAIVRIAAGEVVLRLPPVFEDHRTSHSIQLSEWRHQAFTDDLDDYVNHSCLPSCRVDVAGLTMVSLSAIAVGQEVTFNYLTTEWDMVQPFTCECDGELREIRGFRHLTAAEQAALAPIASEWMLERRR